MPNVLIDEEINALQQQTKQQMAMYTGKKPEDMPDAPREHFLKDAERRVRLSLLLGEVVRKFDIKADAKKVRAKIEEMAKSYPEPEEVVNWYFSNKQHLQMIESQVLEQEAIDKLMSEADLVTKKIAVDELLSKK